MSWLANVDWLWVGVIVGLAGTIILGAVLMLFWIAGRAIDATHADNYRIAERQVDACPWPEKRSTPKLGGSAEHRGRPAVQMASAHSHGERL